MLGWLLLIIVVVSAITLRAVVGKSLPGIAKPIWSKALLVTLLFAGGFLTVYSTFELQHLLNRKDWINVEGTVVESGVSGTGSFRPMIVYTYEAERKTLVDTSYLQVPGFGNRARQFEVAEKLIRKYAAGSKLSVYYDPADHSQSALIVTPAWNVYGKIGLGVVLFAVAMFFLVLPGRVKNN